jgi:hypothetical protein
MFDNLNLLNCPEEFALNCKNYEVQCHKCKGNKTSKYLKYIPIDIYNNKEHPASVVQKSKLSSYSRQGRSNEKKLIDKSSLLNSTYASGMIGSDGDAFLELNHLKKVKVEIKSRFTSKTSISPTLKEYREAFNKNISIHLIYNKYLNKSFYFIDMKLFTVIWQSILLTNDIYKIEEYIHLLHSYKVNVINFYKRSTNPILKNSLHRTVHFSFIENINGSNYSLQTEISYDKTLNLIKNKVGSYVAMNQVTFKELIDFYQCSTKNIDIEI